MGDLAYVSLWETAETKTFLITSSVIPVMEARSEVGRSSSQTMAWFEQCCVFQLCLWDQMNQLDSLGLTTRFQLRDVLRRRMLK